jgi:WD40 repeat protein/energy-coupling factor transporter ATP-binding protein EcfA2
MSKSVVINLGHGNLKKGFPKVAAQLWEAGHSQPEQFIGSLPPAPQLEDLYKNWRTIYQSLCDRVAVRDEHRKLLRTPVDDDDLEVESFGITNVSEFSFEDLCRELEAGMNDWLRSEELLSLSRQLRSALHKTEEIRVIFESDDDLLRRLPWHRCDFFRDYPKAEISIAQPEYHRKVCSNLPSQRQHVRILAILGNDQGIDLDAETQCLSDLTDCYVNFVRNPSRQEFNNCLWDSLGWDMIFFAGHSQTVGDTGRLYINNDKTNNSLTIEQLSEALNAAIDKGLKLAIFNSCDGMGLANTLAHLHIPTTIVMREPVPNRVAEVFFKNFLTAFAIQKLPLYPSVQQARRQLQGLEDEFPGASWLPVICQNPAIEPPTWLNLGGVPPCPYRGLFAFREQDAHLFFGREQFTRDLVTAVKRKPLVAVVGPSGSGKSSVVFAGLVPHLRRDTICPWEVISLRPGSSPIAALASAVAHLPPSRSQAEPGNAYREGLPLVKTVSQPIVTRIQEGQQALPARMRSQALPGNEIQSPSTLYRTIERFVQQNSGTRLVLIVDQFEELYTLCPEPERQYFLDALLTAVEKAPAFTLVITLRADFYGYALSDRNLSDALQGAVLNLAPMNQQELHCAIATSAAQMQVHLEGGLTNRIIRGVEGHPGRLPLLEFALTQLWSKQHQGMLTNQAYDEIGGVECALANHAEAEYAQLEERDTPTESLRDRNRAQRIFMQLIQPGEGIEATRRIATREEVKQENWDLVTRLASSRLVVTNRNEFTGEETVEIVHEALVRSWGRLEHWLQLDGEFRNWQEQLRSAIRQWERSNGDEGTILRGKPLVDAEYWYKLRSSELSASDRAFVELGLEVRNSEYQKQQKRRRVTVFGLSVGLVLALLLAGVAMRQSRRANIREVEAISRSSQALLASNNRLDALVNAIAAFAKLQKYQNSVPSDTKTLVKSTLQEATYGAAWLQKPGSRFAQFNRLSGHQAAIYTVALSPDQVIATGSADKTIKLWQPDGKLITTLTDHNDTVWGITFSPDGGVMATASDDKTVKLWKRYGASYTLVRTLNVGAQVYAVAFSPDGEIIATGDKNRQVKLWKANGTFLTSLEGHTNAVTAVKFSSDARFIASASDDATVRIWRKNQDKYELLRILRGHEGVVKTVAFSPDSEILATAGADKTVRLWTIDGTLIKTLDGHNDTVYEVAFSPNGQTIATASQDKTIKLWQRDGNLITTLAGDSDRIYAVAFSPNGKTIVSAGRSRIAKLWKTDKSPLTTLNGHIDRVWGVAFSPDGRTLVSGGSDKTIKFWKPDGTLIRSFTGHEDRIYGVVFSPDGKTIASVSRDKTIKLWKPDSTLINILKGHTKWVAGVAFSPDSKIIASASNDNSIKLWKSDGTLIKTLNGHTQGVNAVAFSPDGQIIASAGSDKTVRLWNDGTLLRTLTSHSDEVTAVAFSPDSRTIASASLDGTIKLWFIDGTLIKTLSKPNGHNDAVTAVAFSPNGKMIASASIDKTIKLWKNDGTLTLFYHFEQRIFYNL